MTLTIHASSLLRRALCRGTRIVSEAFEADPRNRVALNVVTKMPAKIVAMNRQAVVRCNHTFSHVAQTTGEMCLAFLGFTVDSEHLTKGVTANVPSFGSGRRGILRRLLQSSR